MSAPSLNHLESMNHKEEIQGSPTQPSINSQPLTPASLSVHEEPWGFLVNKLNRTSILLMKDELTVGRSNCDYTFDELSLPSRRCFHKSCSRRHFKIFRTKRACGGYIVSIQNLSSTGTFINRVTVGRNECTTLSDMDEISVVKPEVIGKGLTVFVFYDQQHRNAVPGVPLEVTTNYDVLEDIGKGGFGKIYLVNKRSTKERMVMKAIKGNSMHKHQNYTTLDEAKLMYKIHHTNVVRVFDTIVIGEDTFIFMEYMAGGDLHRYVQNLGRYLTESEAKFICYQIIRAVVALHDRKIVHRDIQPLNILLNSKSEFPLVKLSDFGLSKVLEQPLEPIRTLCGTKSFAAPELNSSLSEGIASHYDNRCDVWSLGIIFFFCISQRLPFEERNDHLSREFRIRTTRIDFEPGRVWCHITEQARSLITAMLKHDYRERLYSREVVKDPYFHNDIILKRKYWRLRPLITRQMNPNEDGSICSSDDNNADMNTVTKKSRI